MSSVGKKKVHRCLCFCCVRRKSKGEEFALDCLKGEFIEYEYVIDNLRVKPVPKKLLDLAPVHSTNISTKSVLKMSHVENNKANGNNRNDNLTGQGDFENNGLKVLPDEYEPSGHCSTVSPNSDGKYESFSKPCGSCRRDVPENVEPPGYKDVKHIIDGRNFAFQIQKSPREIVTRSNQNQDLPAELKAIARFNKPLPEYHTRTEKSFKPAKQELEVYCIPGRKQLESVTELTKSANDKSIETEETHGSLINEKNDSTVQTDATEIVEPCQRKKQLKKCLKWKIVISKHGKKK
ncbi:uncharacterized protein LOC132697185 [Cylas formicarius]|uniref:uncharacterized protein LOC132697185 n=1 Tax=Cylas formicarius TaxID=197179 RepID=UPI0029585D36|nr:uncharacterized protein LOC132697185 [Cylas formicarius]